MGNNARPGEWTGLRLLLRDNGSRQRQVLIRVESMDPDGDHPTYQLERTLNPGVDQFEWVYLRLPFRFGEGDSITVSIYEALETGDAGFIAGRLVSRGALTPLKSHIRHASEGVIGVVGDHTLGLLKYQYESGLSSPPANDQHWHPLLHERVVVANGIDPAQMPDRWMGLAALDALVWGAGETIELRGDRANALRDWVERGGHFVIILPPVGQTWSNAASNELHEIMPLVAVQRNEGVELEPYRPLINASIRRGGAVFPRTGVVHTFRKLEAAKAEEAMEILNGPDGKCVAVRRLVGAGAVTLVGLDLNQTALSQGNLIDAEVLWHRILGRRGRLTQPVRDPSQPGPAPLGVSRQPYPFDDDIADQIVHKGRAAVGVLAGFVMFVAYWVVAGPLGYAVLKAKGKQKHAWLAFLAVTLVFTGLAWGGASLMRPRRVQGRHLTLVDHVYGQPIQRARAWASILIPWYGEAELAVKRSTGDRSLNAIVAWDSPKGDAWSGFPDSRAYIVDARRPDAIRVPTRSTSKVIQADWAGGPAWAMPRPTGPGGVGPGELVVRQDWMRGTRAPLLSGTLVHDLPATLTDITIVVVRRQTPLTRARPGVDALDSRPLVIADAFSMTDWEPGVALDLALKTQIDPAATATQGAAFITWMETFRPAGAGLSFSDVPVDPRTLVERLSGLAFFPFLPPPDLENNASNEFAYQRKATHGWDLGRWLTQPCVIIVGHVAGKVGSPVPITVDGQEVEMEGRTVVRWVYPLPTDPPRFPSPDQPDLQEGAEPVPTPDSPSEPPADGTGG